MGLPVPQRAVAPIDAGIFADEIVPVKELQEDGTLVEFSVDEHPRRDTSLEKLASLKVLHPGIDGFSITAGDASGVNDAPPRSRSPATRWPAPRA